jgi:hypothetical protein
MNLTYSLTTTNGDKSNLTDSIVSIKFHDIDDKWNIDYKAQNGSTSIPLKILMLIIPKNNFEDKSYYSTK